MADKLVALRFTGILASEGALREIGKGAATEVSIRRPRMIVTAAEWVQHQFSAVGTAFANVGSAGDRSHACWQGAHGRFSVLYAWFESDPRPWPEHLSVD
jgi:hypothetical protein